MVGRIVVAQCRADQAPRDGLRYVNRPIAAETCADADGASYNHPMRSILITSLCTLLVGADWAWGAPPADRADQDRARQLEFFEKKIRPVLVKTCLKCHSATSKEIGGKLRLDHRPGAIQGGESGPAIVPGKPAQSLLIQAIEYRDGLEMPPDEKLPAEVVQNFKTWIANGAVDPRVAGNNQPRNQQAGSTPGRDLWSLKPITNPAVPEVGDMSWARSEIDRFLLARLEDRGLSPVADASPGTLLRRLHFDLVGLPPSPRQVDAFERDHGEAAYLRVVDKLLASPQFGERWARHWLDVARYAESAGSSRDVLMIWAWRYRDYVIDAVSQDVPYDRFLTEQIAGDLLPAASPGEARRLQIATGLLAIGQKSLNGGNIPLDVIDDQLDVIGKAILGMTIACARCHDHKFDPIPTADYYALAGIFRSTETLFGGNTNRPKTVDAKMKVYLVLGDASKAKKIQKHQKKVQDLQKQRNALAKRKTNLEKRLPAGDKKKVEQPAAASAGSDRDRKAPKPAQRKKASQKAGKLRVQYETVVKRLAALDKQLKALKAVPQPTLEFAVGVRDRGKVADGPIQVRGERKKAGQVVPRGFLTSVIVDDPPVVTNKQSGRLELADWLTRPDNPLTSRVMVNRTWSHLFGQGLVSTTENFGHNGQPPSHPRLLDWLAHRFVRQHKWSRKSLIREMVLSRAYRLSSDHDPAAFEADPAARLVWRHNRRRLEAEAIRDAMLAVSGRLDLDRPTASAVTRIGEGEVGRNLNIKPLTEPFPHRSVYLPIIRGILPEFLKLFDFPDPSNPQGVRDATSIPAQSLFLLNSPFVLEQADALAARLLARDEPDAERIQHAYRLTLGRGATESERARAASYIEKTAASLGSGDNMTAGRSNRQRAFSLFCQVLLAGAEFRYLD